MRPYVETVFRNPLLLLVPAILVPILVAVGAYLTARHYEASAALWAWASSDIGGAPSPSFRPPAADVAQRFEERLSTESFRSKIITSAGLDQQVENAQWPPPSGLGTLLSKTPLTKPMASLLGLTPPATAGAAYSQAIEQVRKGLSVEARGDNLVRIAYSGDDPEIGVALVNAAIETYQEEEVSGSTSQAQAFLQFYEEQVIQGEADLGEADAALRSFEEEHPDAEAMEGWSPEARELDRLQGAYNTHLAQHEQAVARLEDAQFRVDTDVSNRLDDFVVVDAPSAPSDPTLDLSQTMALLFMGVVFGAGVGSVLVLVRTWSDHTLRRAEDVELRLRVPVLASLPQVREGS